MFKISLNVILVSFFVPLLSACVSSPNIERKHYYAWENDYGYSQVVRAGNTIYVSGIASNKANLPQQITEIYQYINRILKDYGVDSDAIVKQVIYTTDIEGLQAQTSLRKSFFNQDKYPSSTIVQIERLYDVEHLLEVELVVVLPNWQWNTIFYTLNNKKRAIPGWVHLIERVAWLQTGDLPQEQGEDQLKGFSDSDD